MMRHPDRRTIEIKLTGLPALGSVGLRSRRLTEMTHRSALSAVLDAALEGSGNKPPDAIVVGAGAAGGWAAMLLTEAGLRVLVLDASIPRAPFRRLVGRFIGRLSTTDGPSFLPPALVAPARIAAKMLGRWRQPVQSRCMLWDVSPNFFVDDRECPYVTPSDRPFVWVRVRMLGGRVAVPGHGRQYYRLGPSDFTPTDGLSPAWPLEANGLDPWYALVERRLGLSGMHDNIPWLPDSILAHHLRLTPAETELRNKVMDRWPSARVIAGRYASPLNSLEMAACTGLLQCRQGAIVREISVDSSGSVSGVVWVDHLTKSERRSSAPLVFLCASALESTRILMLSRSRNGSKGLGQESGALGRYLMDHVLVSAEGIGPPITQEAAPTDRCLYLPRFDARDSRSFQGRGYGVQLYLGTIGSRLHFTAHSFAEMLPRWANRISLDPTQRDAWFIPVPRIDCAYSDVEMDRARDQTQALRQLAELLKVEVTRIHETPEPPGSSYHECGTARMGKDPKDSVVDPNNECWDARGLYVTDAACFPSQGIQNPTLTILALTARACHHALRAKERACNAVNT